MRGRSRQGEGEIGSSRDSGFPFEPVAYPIDRVDPEPFTGHGSYLLSQMGEMGVNGPVEGLQGVGKEIEDFRPGDDLPLPSCQEGKNVELPPAEKDLFAVDLGSASGDIDREFAKADWIGCRGLLPEQSAHSGGEFVEAEGFPDMVVGPEGERVNG